MLWIAQAKGLVGIDVEQRVYSSRGTLLSTLSLTLEAVKFTY